MGELLQIILKNQVSGEEKEYNYCANSGVYISNILPRSIVERVEKGELEVFEDYGEFLCFIGLQQRIYNNITLIIKSAIENHE